MQEDDEETVERRQSLGTQRPELALDPGMAAHVVDALFDKCGLPYCNAGCQYCA